MVLQIKWPWDGLGRLCDQVWDIDLGLNIKYYKTSVICFEFAETKLLLPTLRWDVRPNHKEYCEHQYLIRLDESKWENCFQFFFTSMNPCLNTGSASVLLTTWNAYGTQKMQVPGIVMVGLQIET